MLSTIVRNQKRLRMIICAFIFIVLQIESLNGLPVNSFKQDESSLFNNLQRDVLRNEIRKDFINRKPAKNLVRPLWMDPKRTWKALVSNSERTDREDRIKQQKRKKKFMREILKNSPPNLVLRGPAGPRGPRGPPGRSFNKTKFMAEIKSLVEDMLKDSRCVCTGE